MEYETPRLQSQSLHRSSLRIRGQVDLPFAMLVLLLLIIGVMMILSASFARAYYDPTNETEGVATYYFTRQLIFAVIGIFGMFICSRLPVSFYRKSSQLLIILSIILLLAVPVIGVRANGAKRWISLGFTTFQPSEIAKIAVVLYFAALICKFKNKMRTIRYGIIPFAVILIMIAGLLALEPHLSATIIIFALGAVMLFLGGVEKKWFLGGIAIVAVFGMVFVLLFPYASTRIATWLNPFDPELRAGDAYQIVQSLISVGSGGLSGLGLGQSRQKYLYLPEEHNDFIFAVICEELGFIGAILILALFALLILRGYWLALHCRDRYSFLVCAGITTMIALQVFLNVAVCTNLIPCTGISLPFFSFGGTALVIQLMEMGIVLSISRDIPARKN